MTDTDNKFTTKTVTNSKTTESKLNSNVISNQASKQKIHSTPTIHSYLAVVAGLCAEADYIFIPEDPPKPDWPERLCKQLSQARNSAHSTLFHCCRYLLNTECRHNIKVPLARDHFHPLSNNIHSACSFYTDIPRTHTP